MINKNCKIQCEYTMRVCLCKVQGKFESLLEKQPTERGVVGKTDKLTAVD